MTVHPVASDTVYRSDAAGGSDPQTVEYRYTWHPNSVRMASMTSEQPVVSATKNGPGGADGDTTVTSYYVYGRPVEVVDADGYATTMAYDPGTGAMTESVVDDGGLNLTTAYVVDALGRTTR